METNEVKKKVLSSFLDNYPEEASIVLMKSDSEHISQFIQNTPMKPLIKTLSLLPIDLLEEALFALQNKKISEVMNCFPVNLAASLFHQWNLKGRIDKNRLDEITLLLDPDLAGSLKRRLYFPVNSIGSIMTAIPFSVKENLTAGEVLTMLRKDKKRYCRYIYITGENLSLIGAIPFKDLFYAKKDTLISSFMTKDLFFLNPEDNIKKTISDPCWRKWETLPVVDLNENLIGLIRYEDLENFILAKENNQEANNSEISVAGNAITEVFHIGIAATVSALLLPLERSKKP